MKINNDKNKALITDTDLDYAFYDCCGDEDMLLLRCALCGHIWAHCYECDTWFTDLNNLEKSKFVESDKPVACPHCDTVFEDQYFLNKTVIHKYLPTIEQVIQAGLGQFLSKELRNLNDINLDASTLNINQT